MKELTLKKNEKEKKIRKKVFTKKKGKDIIKKNNNPFEANCKLICKRRRGYNMENVILNEIRKELSREYNIKEKVVEILFEKCKEFNYTVEESKELIKEFFGHK